ncbi:DUF5719 family protein [Aeromicrobium sp. CTD01-1L150]|uniref:DUF5719 family protein n=1 Tax=Aeromicrobium sp. CTD01-1L150 TaxID=3341830 RepID=UPI0035BFF08B
MRRLTLAALPVVAVLLLALVAVVPATTDQAREPRPVEVDQTSYACVAGAGHTIAATQVEPGDEAQAITLPDGDEVGDLQDASRYRAASVRAADVLVRQSGRASGAVGHTAGTQDGNLFLGACPGIVDEAWFTGLGSTTQHGSILVLTNLADVPAVVDLRLWGQDGEIDAVDSEGVVVEPRSTRRLRVADLAAGEEDVAVALQRRRGALSAVVDDGSPHGRSLVPAAASPSSRVQIGTLPASGAARVLRLVNPTDSTARVAVAARGTEGTFVPEGLDEVEVGAGQTSVVELPAALGETPVSLELSASARITGDVQTVGRDDAAVTPTVQPWSGPAVVPLRLGGPELDSVVLTAPSAEARVSVEAFDEQGQSVAETRVEVGEGSSVEADLGDVLQADDAAYLVLRSEGGVLGTANYSAAGGLAALPLTAAPVTAQGPAVRWGAPSR